jgi:hypothetical protein
VGRKLETLVSEYVATLDRSTRGGKIRAALAREFGKGTPLPAARRAVAKKIGETPSALLSFDGVYFVLAGYADPLPASAAKSARSLASAVRKRRDAGVRWETVAASASETLGRVVSVREAKTLYAKGGGDLDASYAGRGTRVGAPKTYADPAAAAEVATS